jgi:hydantoinase/carbamoylase family amidase
MSELPAIDAGRVIADLRELDRRTGGADGAQRLCWSEGWRAARWLLEELLEELGLKPERDEAGNLWASLDSAGGPTVAVGSHLDSVPGGGWLDGALGVMAALGVLRAWSADGVTPARPLTLIDWADEEGARFGRSLFGSSAFSGTLEVEELRGLRDADGRSIAEVLSENGIELNEAPRAERRRAELAAYLELHIEQGPVLEAEGSRAAAVDGCVGIERHRFRFTGQTSHAGTTPMDRRRDAGLTAAEMALQVEAIGQRHDGVATAGALALSPGIPTAVAGEAELLVDLRHPDAGELAAMLGEAEGAGAELAARRKCALEVEPVWRIDPIKFDSGLVEAARLACADATGSDRVLTSGALHDAAEVSRVLPAAMVFCPSIAGISHAKEEDTSEEDLAAGIEAFGLLANRVVASA